MSESSANRENKELLNQGITSLVEDMIVDSLRELKDLSNEIDANSNNKFKLIFPKYRNKKDENESKNSSNQDNKLIRYSEQEARFLFCKEIENNEGDFFYSIETPTTQKYQFSGKGAKSGSIDVCIYNSSANRVCNIEFKAKQSKEKEIQKDFEKLLREEGANFLIHFLHNQSGTEKQNNETYNALIKKYINTIEKAVHKIIENSDSIVSSQSCSIFICKMTDEPKTFEIKRWQMSDKIHNQIKNKKNIIKSEICFDMHQFQTIYPKEDKKYKAKTK